MKKILLALVVSCLSVAALRADLVWYEGFNYSDGPTIAVATNLDGSTNWFRHSGNASPSDSVVRAQRLEISTSGAGLARTDDISRRICAGGGCTLTNGLNVLFSSFTINFTNLPTANGAYFAHFLTNAQNFYCRVWGLRGNSTGTSNVFSALPGTYRIGISAGTSGSPNKIFPVDLATNTDYQVVVEWDPVTLLAATLWINPINSADFNLVTSDSLGLPSASNMKPVVSFGFRQATGFGGFLTVSNVALATTFDEAATNVWSTTPVSPVIVYPPKSGTNFEGNTVLLSGVAAGQGLGSMTYQWLKDGDLFTNPDGSTNTLRFASAAIPDSGAYQLVATTPYGLSATSAVANLWITNAPVPPTFTLHPSNTAVYFHQTATLTAAVGGPPTISCQWLYYPSLEALTATNFSVSGALGEILTIADVDANNGTATNYVCVASNPYGSKTSAVATVTATAPPAVSIAFLRTLVDPASYLATNSTAVYQITGTVTTFTNLTTGNTSSYYLWDGTAGINIFATFGQAFRPALGDVVTFVGVLSSYNSTLELLADTVNNPATSYTILSNNLASLPAPRVIPFSITNNLAYCETNLEGSIVMLTNVYFGASAGTMINTNTSGNATSVVVTNGNGETFNVGFAAVDLDVAGQILPSFAWSVRGPLTQNLNNSATPRNAGYQVTVTKFSDIVTNPPVAVTISDSYAGNSTTLTWTAVPYDYSYTVLAAPTVNGPYVPIATGLTFPTSSGSYTDTDAGGVEKYYRVVSP